MNKNRKCNIPTLAILSLLGISLLSNPMIGFSDSVNNQLYTDEIERLLESEMCAILENGEKISIDGKNTIRQENKLIIYTDSNGPKTNQNRWGREVVVGADGIVVSNVGPGEKDTDGGEEIPKRGYVISAHGDRMPELEGIKVGDSIKLEGLDLIDLNKETKYKLAAINPNEINNPGGVESPGNPYPGFRGQDQLIIYTSEYEMETTGTNDYGAEIVVEGTLEEGVIVSKGGNNNKIPEEGYILSGHGEAASFLVNDGMIGASVSVDMENDNVVISITPKSLLVSAKSSYEDASKSLEDAKLRLLDIDYEESEINLKRSEEHLKNATELAKIIEMGDTSSEVQFKFLDEVEAIEKTSLNTQYFATESRVVDARGLWHRPSETNLQQVTKTLDELKENNINMLFIETLYDGYTIYPTKNEVITQRDNFKNANYGEYGNDLLKAFVEEGKKRGIEVHTWVHTFRAGDKEINPILSQEEYEDWTLINYNNTELTIYEDDYYFMDPANPEVRNCLTEIYKEIASNYDVDGIQLDYIRYPVGKYKSDSGYGKNDDSTMNQFRKEYNISSDTDIRELMDKDKNQDWKVWEDRWNEFKQGKITTFVKDVSEELEIINKDILVSTAIFPNIEEAKMSKMQDWPKWVENGYIDLTAPMAYYKDAQTVKEDVTEMVEYVGGNCLNYAGIAPTFVGLIAPENRTHVKAALEGKAQGTIVFASQNLLGIQDVQHVLKSSTHRENAITPHSSVDKVVAKLVDSIIDKCNKIYMPSMSISQKNLEKLINELESIKKLAAKENIYLDKIVVEIGKLINKIDKYVDGEAKNRIVEELEYLTEILETRMKINK
ncbi:MAG: glycoside hydrolase family 10 protein [Peptostreptococcaceae bacterium]